MTGRDKDGQWRHKNTPAQPQKPQIQATIRSCQTGQYLIPIYAHHNIDLVMATKLHNTDAGSDAALMVDVDLSILGQNEKRFAEYEDGIRAEYSWVAQDVFNSKRSEILQRFLNRERIYSAEHFTSKYELQARRNLEKSVVHLRTAL